MRRIAEPPALGFERMVGVNPRASNNCELVVSQ
jgi:hypothetical protein